jgi:hypothetical protein
MGGALARVGLDHELELTPSFSCTYVGFIGSDRPTDRRECTGSYDSKTTALDGIEWLASCASMGCEHNGVG